MISRHIKSLQLIVIIPKVRTSIYRHISTQPNTWFVIEFCSVLFICPKDKCRFFFVCLISTIKDQLLTSRPASPKLIGLLISHVCGNQVIEILSYDVFGKKRKFSNIRQGLEIIRSQSPIIKDTSIIRYILIAVLYQLLKLLKLILL